jgi:quercetin dioxygenase-like cupin family protein
MAKKRVTKRKAANAKSKRQPKASLKRAPLTATLQYIPWNTVPLEDLNPLLQRQFVVGQQIMLARVLLKKGCVVPEHSHHNEQLTYILEGALKFWIDGKEVVVNAGETLCIPSRLPHKAEALEDTVDLDVFAPPRADWINKTDQYLRGKK